MLDGGADVGDWDDDLSKTHQLGRVLEPDRVPVFQPAFGSAAKPAATRLYASTRAPWKTGLEMNLMRAVALTDYGSGLRGLDKAVPEPGDGELLVRVHASSINPIDVYVSSGRYGRREYEFPAVPGRDFAGTVERTGAGVSDFRS